MKRDVKRFQECNFFVRLWRRLKYQPKYFFKALYIATKVRFSPNNQYRFKFVFSLIYTEWQMKAEWHYTTEEVFGNLKKRIMLKKGKRVKYKIKKFLGLKK